jgi:hypothetical protein
MQHQIVNPWQQPLCMTARTAEGELCDVSLILAHNYAAVHVPSLLVPVPLHTPKAGFGMMAKREVGAATSLVHNRRTELMKRARS